MAKLGLSYGALLFFGLVHACGSSSTSPGADAGGPADASGTSLGDGGSPASCNGSPVSWKDDGATICASTVVASGLHGNTPGNPDDTVQITAIQGLAIGLSIGVASPPPLGGTYGCTPSPTGTVILTYRDAVANATTVDSCSVTVNLVPAGDGGADAGAVHAVGTFSAVLSVPDAGTTKNLTDGAFDVLVQY
jgi:hypothetical protein